jgi:hypothetical protein
MCGGARRRAGRRPWHVLLVAFGLLLAQGPMLLHLLLVPHVTCEHGELVEGARAGRDPEHPRAAADRTDQQQIERAHGDGAGHDHCDALAVRHRVPEVGASVASASLLWVVPIEAGGDHAETRPVPLLSLAPKSSPPAA